MTVINPPRPFVLRRGFSLIEVLLAVFILGVGVIAIASLFPAGIAQQRRSVEDITGPIIAENAMSILRSKLSQDDFGTLEQHMNGSGYGTWSDLLNRTWQIRGGTLSGDWTWIRPTVFYQDDGGTPIDERGAIEIFRNPTSYFSGTGASEFGSGDPIQGVPWNTEKYGLVPTSSANGPNVIITRAERTYPMVTPAAANEGNVPQYYWDCMFRRFQGRVQVAVFVYRVKRSTALGNVQFTMPPSLVDAARPTLPHRLLLVNDGSGLLPDPSTAGWDPGWDAWGIDPNDRSTYALVPETGPGDPLDLADLTVAPNFSWQEHGQLIVDQNGAVHSVLSGRANIDDGPVELFRPVQVVPTLQPYVYDPAPTVPADIGAENIVTDIWYLPRTLGDPVTGGVFELTPIYVTVEEL